MDLRDRQHLMNGFGNGLSRAFEIAVTPAVFAGLGLGIDATVGVWPWATLGLLVFALFGIFIRTWYAYDAEMRAHEQAAAWARPEHSSTAPELSR